jgi:hypothetical protein
MTRDEFIDVCDQGGYCSRTMATMYVKKTGKEIFTLDDCIETYRMVDRALDVSRDTGKFKQGFRQNGNKFRSTKVYKLSERMGSNKND